jgi:8-oxo-dGTP diphosphatase
MARAPVLAAGGVVTRGDAKPRIAIVRRRKDNNWVLPRGKLKRKEKAILGAEREVVEETGYKVRVHEFIGAIAYSAHGKPKVVQFWRMRAGSAPKHEITRDIKAVKWLPLDLAIKKLHFPLEKLLLRSVGRRVMKLSRKGGKRHGRRKKHKKQKKIAARRRKSTKTPRKARNTSILRRLFKG